MSSPSMESDEFASPKWMADLHRAHFEWPLLVRIAWWAMFWFVAIPCWAATKANPRVRYGAWAAIGLGFLIAGIASGGDDAAVTTETAAEVSVDEPATTTEPPAETTDAQEEEAVTTTTAAPATTTTAAPATTTTASPSPADGVIPGPGIWLVGTEVTAGTYRTTVPEDSSNCYWARLSDASGDFDAIIANDNWDAGATVTVTIDASDFAFESGNCGEWVLI